MLSSELSAVLTKASDYLPPWLRVDSRYQPLAVYTFGAVGLGLAVKTYYQKQMVEKHDLPRLIPKLSEKRQGPKLPGTVVICGGSISGLLAAAVCCHHFEKVVVVEPEEWLLTEAGLTGDGVHPKRAHVMQYDFLHHYHIILTLALQQLFPDFPDELAKLGGRFSQLFPCFTISGMQFVTPANYPFYAPYKQFPPVFALTRPKFEALVRRLVRKQYPNIEYIAATGTGLVPSKDFKSIDAISLRYPDGKIADLPASLVIDCTGFSTYGYRWLKAIPYYNDQSPKLDTLRLSYDHKLHFNTLLFDIPDDLMDTIKDETKMPLPFRSGIRLYGYLPISAIEAKSIIIERRENNLLIMAFGGWDVREKVTNAEEAAEFLKTIKTIKALPEWIYKLIAIMARENVPCQAEHLRYPNPVNIQYYKAKNLPSNFIAIGDAVTQLCPFTGQGTIKSSMQAAILAMLLSRYQKRNALPSNFSRDFFQETENRVGYLWYATKDLDYSFKTTIPVPGEKRDKRRTLAGWISSRLMRLALIDPEVSTLDSLLRASLITPTSVYPYLPWILGKMVSLWLAGKFKF